MKRSAVASYEEALASGLVSCPRENVEDLWLRVRAAIHSAGVIACSTSVRSNGKSRISAESLEPLDARRNIPTISQHESYRTELKRNVCRSLKRDREA